MLSIAAAVMARDGDDRLASVSLFAAQTDFTEVGELQLFITENQLDVLIDITQPQGYLDSAQMDGRFRMSHASDLVCRLSVGDGPMQDFHALLYGLMQ